MFVASTNSVCRRIQILSIKYNWKKLLNSYKYKYKYICCPNSVWRRVQILSTILLSPLLTAQEMKFYSSSTLFSCIVSYLDLIRQNTINKSTYKWKLCANSFTIQFEVFMIVCNFSLFPCDVPCIALLCVLWILFMEATARAILSLAKLDDKMSKKTELCA